MLRAMQEALQAHALSHPNEPFDHERHMPGCMREARDDPATWSGGGNGGDGGTVHSPLESTEHLRAPTPREPGCNALRDRCAWQGFSDLAKDTVVAELKRGWEEESGKIVILKDVLQSLSDANLLLLAAGSEKEVANTKVAAPAPSKFPTIFDNFKKCMAEAWPDYNLKTNDTGKSIDGRRFRGFYIDGVSENTA